MSKRTKLVLSAIAFGESVFHPDVEAFTQTFLHAGYEELDTAYVYNENRCEALSGEAIKKMGRDRAKISTEVNPRISGKLDGEAASKQLDESLDRLGINSVDTFYLHFPGLNTPVESVLEICAVLYDQGKYKELGLGNFPAQLAVDIYHKCREHGWVLPTTYEGIYNPLTRKVETELNTILGYFGIRFYAYNPMADGLLTGRYGRFEEIPAEGWFTHRPNYQRRYWKESYLDTADVMKAACERGSISIIEAVYRWLAYRSILSERRGDAILVGAPKLSCLEQNMETVNAGPLPSDMAGAFSSAWEPRKADSPKYFTFYKGTTKEQQKERCQTKVQCWMN